MEVYCMYAKFIYDEGNFIYNYPFLAKDDEEAANNGLQWIKRIEKKLNVKIKHAITSRQTVREIKDGLNLTTVDEIIYRYGID